MASGNGGASDPPARHADDHALDGLWRFLNAWMGVAGAYGLMGLAVGLRETDRFHYMDRNLAGVFLATLQKFVGPAMQNGLMLGLWVAIFLAVSRRMGGRVWLRAALAIPPIAALALVVALVTRTGLEGGRLVSVTNWLLAVESFFDFLRLVTRLDMASKPLLFRFWRISQYAAVGLVSMLILNAVLRRFLSRSSSPARPAGKAPATIGFILLLLLSTLLGRSSGDPMPPDAPDIILVSIDTLRADHLPLYGYDRETAPHLGALAADGVVVDQFIANAPWTLLSHASMFTGLLPYQHGAIDWSYRIRDSVGVFTEELKQRSYRTGGFVTTVYVSSQFGFGRGFDIFQLNDLMDATANTRAALGWFFADQAPSFLFLHLFDVHHPYNPPPEFLGRFGPLTPMLQNPRQRFSEFTDWAQSDPSFTSQAAMDRYDETVAYVDEVLGRFFDVLKKAGRYDNALIVVLSDHGEEFYDHGFWGHSNYLYEEMLRVPLVVKFPHGVCGGSRLSGGAVPATAIPRLILEGSRPRPGSLTCGPGGAPVLVRSLVQKAPILAETQSLGPHRFAARTTTEKLIEPFTPTDPMQIDTMGRDWEYYRLDRDKEERFNFYQPGVAPALERAIADARKEMGESTAAGEGIQLDRNTIERLKSLGYLN